jgi:hypothetical protein
MRNSKGLYLLLITIVLAAYYIILGVYINKLGYYNQESLFYIEKSKIIVDGIGNRLKVMGLTSPLIPFYGTFLFTAINYALAPVIASSFGMAMLFYIMASTMVKRINDDYYLLLLCVLFLFHPGLIYAACSGKSIYAVLIFFYLFFLNMLKFYNSNTTFHISIASICFVMLIFSDYKFIWLSLFFIPLILSISIHTLNLSERESIFRLFLSFNNPSLRRKLINKTFSIYMIIFILPLSSIMIYKMLNLTHANDLNYFLESPYATWSVLTDKIDYSLYNQESNRYLSENSILLSFKALLYCPLILVAIYLLRQYVYQILTILTPFGLIEFLRVKYEKTSLPLQYFIIFMILAMLCIIYKATPIRKQLTFKLFLTLMIGVQLYTGYIFLKKSTIAEEQNFMATLLQKTPISTQEESITMAGYLNSLGSSSQILVDDAVAYPVVAYVNDIRNLTMPYQDNYLSAIESPNNYDDYMLIANEKNPVSGYTQLNNSYLQILKAQGHMLNFIKVYQTDHWALYRIR